MVLLRHIFTHGARLELISVMAAEKYCTVSNKITKPKYAWYWIVYCILLSFFVLEVMLS